MYGGLGVPSEYLQIYSTNFSTENESKKNSNNKLNLFSILKEKSKTWNVLIFFTIESI